jgi:CRP/FNR family transcriptional regulator, cyclic AMP receptor protein
MPEATLDQLSRIQVFSSLQQDELKQLQPYTTVRCYLSGAVVLQEADRLPPRLYALVAGSIRITKLAATGKETILRTLEAGEIFAAPALFGNGIAPATVTAEKNCEVLMVERDALLEAIRHRPEIALSMLSLFNHRLQQLHNTVHGLVSERALVRLVRYIQYCAAEQGTEITRDGVRLRQPLPYYQIARSIGITYEECVRLFKQLQPAISYGRGGKIVVHDEQKLEEIATGAME